MRYTSILLSILVIATVTSCQKTDLGQPSVAHDSNDNTVALSEAVEVASSFATSEKSFLQTRSSDPTVKETFSIKDDNIEPYFHVVNFENGGFVAISGDNRTEPILAYSNDTYWENNPEEYPYGLMLWIDNTKAVIDSLRTTNAKQGINIKKKWDSFTPKKLTRSLDPGSGVAVEIDTTVGPLIFDSWHRYQPYNDSLDLVYKYIGNYYIRPTVGCVPLSIARIVRFHSYPTSYPWSSILDNGSSSPATKQYIKNVYYDVKSYCETHGYMFYQDDYGNTFVDSDLPISSLINDKFGGWSGAEMSYNTANPSHVEILKNEFINHSRPVIISGGGHMWVCDGCHYKVEVEYDDLNQPIAFVYTTFHHRWGEEGNAFDGWFAHNNLSPGNHNLNSNVILTYNLSPL